MKKHKYLVSYQGIKTNGQEIFGDIVIETSNKITSYDMDDIRVEIVKICKDDDVIVNKIVITSIFYFGKE